MSQRTLLSRLAMVALAFIALVVFTATGSSTASAQCNGANCPFIKIDTDPTNPCAAPITSFQCAGGAIVPAGGPFAPGGVVNIPCPCLGPGGLAGIWVGMKFIPIRATDCISVAAGCNLFYDVQVDNLGCITVKITPC